MRVVEQVRLGYREGKSDKVYEIDLVEVAPAQHVVNFRYGRRGSTLREGTKTALPVSLEKAGAVFNALVSEKTKAGYKVLGDAAPAAAPTPITPSAAAARTKRALLEALARGQRGERPLHLTVRQVGELGLSEAEPLLLELLAAKRSPKQPEARGVPPRPGGSARALWERGGDTGPERARP